MFIGGWIDKLLKLINDFFPTITKNTVYSFLTVLILLIIYVIFCRHRNKIAKIKKEKDIEIEKQKTQRAKHHDDTLLKTIKALVGDNSLQNNNLPPPDINSKDNPNIINYKDYILKNDIAEIINDARNFEEEKHPTRKKK